MIDPDAVLGLEPDDLDGHTIEELDDYLAQNRRPADPSIDNSPACQIALGALGRLREAARSLLAVRPDDRRNEDDWIANAIASISLEAHTGRRFPLPFAIPNLRAVVTEGALRGLIRAVGDDVPGVLVGSVRIDTDDPPRVAVLRITIAVEFGYPLLDAADLLRAALAEALPDHLPFVVDHVDVRVVDVLDLRVDRKER